MNLKDVLLAEVEARARRRLGALAGELAHADDRADKESIRAGIEFERWLADSCADCRSGS